MSKYDVIIVGAGPAGIFAALELVSADMPMKVLMLEKGKDLSERVCPAEEKGTKCVGCKLCSTLSGWGGAGAYSDGKLTLTPNFGGFLESYIDRAELVRLIDYVDSVYVRFGAPEEVHGEDEKDVKRLMELAVTNDLELVPARIRHMGTERCLGILNAVRDHLRDKLEVRFNTPVSRVIVEKKKAIGVVTAKGEEIMAKHVILSPGREGADWLAREAKRLRLKTLTNPVDIGVRVELPAATLKPLTDVCYESKLIYYTKKFDDKVRTFCMNPYGEVVREYSRGITTVNGHSYANFRTNNTNFALLVSTYFTEPFNEPIKYGSYIAKLANFLGENVIVQRLGDLQQGRRSTPERIRRGLVEPTLSDATPGDLSFVFPYRYLYDIMEMLVALDRICPGVNSRHTLLYGVEVKFYSMRLELGPNLMSQVENMYAVGDGAGVSRGLIQASASGVIAARDIIDGQG